MNAAERAQLAELAGVVKRYLDLPRPGGDAFVDDEAWVGKWQRADVAFCELQRARALEIGHHLAWITDGPDEVFQQHAAIAIRMMNDEMAKPLPYPVEATS